MYLLNQQTHEGDTMNFVLDSNIKFENDLDWDENTIDRCWSSSDSDDLLIECNNSYLYYDGNEWTRLV